MPQQHAGTRTYIRNVQDPRPHGAVAGGAPAINADQFLSGNTDQLAQYLPFPEKSIQRERREKERWGLVSGSSRRDESDFSV